MDRRLLIPMVTLTAWAQQPSPEAAAAEKTLRARAEQFYQLQVDKKFRAAEAFVAEDTKDLYFAGQKPDLQGFSIVKVELLENNTKAKVALKTKSTMLMMGVGRLPIDVPSVVLWKIENGQWVWYIDAQAPIDTPFGPVKPTKGGSDAPGALPPMAASVKDLNLESFMKQVTIDHTSVTFAGGNKEGKVEISNAMPGYVDVTYENSVPGLTAHLDTAHVPAGGKATLLLVKSGEGKVAGVVHVTVAPLNTVFDIRVQTRDASDTK